MLVYSRLAHGDPEFKSIVADSNMPTYETYQTMTGHTNIRPQ